MGSVFNVKLVVSITQAGTAYPSEAPEYTPGFKWGSCYSIFSYTRVKNPIFRHINSNNSGTGKVKIVKNERNPPLFTSKQLIKF
jgi:hypothetical protein